MSKKQHIIVIGSGFAGLSAASVLAKNGYQVTVLEKNDQPGGRARLWEKDGFKFDMGPSWYWMPDVFDDYFALFGKKTSDFYDLKRLDPGYQIYFGKNDVMEIPASMQKLEQLFEQEEPGSSEKLRDFLKQAAYKYKVGMGEYVFRPSHSITEFIDFRLIKESFRIQMLTSMSKHVREYFKNPKLIKLLEFPVLFLGATPQNTPAMYSMMNHADLVLGTWYPMGGMNELVKAMVKTAQEQGVEIKLNHEVLKIEAEKGKAKYVITKHGIINADFVIAGADYEHAPEGCENLFFLMPVAPDLQDDEATREHYFTLMLDRFEKITGQEIRNNIVVKRSYAHQDFIVDYHSYKGNAYGLANTLKQTAFFKPAMKSKKIKNLLFTGQLTVPGPGVPPSIISGQVAAQEAQKILVKEASR
ncbi:MAG: phytoene desaturase [Sphingobacteriaceae bacterium]|nr:MAG: phytoene desaturase [Sphingobacteriaceae bacterium]